jgi:hypothetical protein
MRGRDFIVGLAGVTRTAEDRARSLSIETLSLKASGRKDPPILQVNQQSDGRNQGLA